MCYDIMFPLIIYRHFDICCFIDVAFTALEKTACVQRWDSSSSRSSSSCAAGVCVCVLVVQLLQSV